MDNNIFKYATSELSQDAIICWCANWLNFKESELYPLAVDFMKLIYPSFDPQVDDEVVIIQQWYKTDILLYLKKSGRAIIIEDKVYSSEHDNQIAVYVEKLSKLSEAERERKGIGEIKREAIHTVYFKTGFYYDSDKLVVADTYVRGKEFLNVLEPYKGLHPILGYFYEHLKDLIGWYDVNGIIGDISGKSHWDWNISLNTIAQYNLMRYLFPEELWDRKHDTYMVYHGSNQGGRPWTEMKIFEGAKADGGGYCVFWRIDTDVNSPYLSLRFYDWSLKKDDEVSMQIHKDKYEEFRGISRSIMESDKVKGIKWDDVKYHYTGGSKETTLIRIALNEELLKAWDEKKAEFKQNVYAVNEEFLRSIG